MQVLLIDDKVWQDVLHCWSIHCLVEGLISLGVSLGDCSLIASSSTFDLRTVSCSEKLPSSTRKMLVLEVGPSFVVALVKYVVFGALGVWFQHHSDAGRGACVTSLCWRNFGLPPTSSSHLQGFLNPFPC